MQKSYFIPTHINFNKEVRVKQCGNIVELMQSSKKLQTTSPITKIDKDTFIVNSTGEIKEYRHIDNKGQCIESVRQSLARLRDMINTNVTNSRQCKWITLTYAENMTDLKKLYQDFQLFNKRFLYKFKNYDNIKYILAVEPQGRGAWHCHLLYIFDCNAPFIDNSTISQLWKQGFTKTKALDNVDNVGAYLTAYLGDMELDDAIKNCCIVDNAKIKENIDVDTKTTKKYVKGARLCLYPPKMHIYRCSRNCKRPTLKYTYVTKNIRNITKNFKLTYSKGIMISSDTFLRDISYQYWYYNIQRDKEVLTSLTQLDCNNNNNNLPLVV